MKFDIAIAPSGDPRQDAELIKRAEALGFAGAWVTEGARNPFFPLTVAAKATSTIGLGAKSAFAFPRSPMVVAQIAWDLARQCDGRFALGLRMGRGRGESTDRDLDRMREYIESLRAIWDTFQNGARLRYRGDHYQFRLMAPFFNPGAIRNPHIPIFLDGACPAAWRLAGEIGNGLNANALHTPATLREIVLPAVESGLRRANRARTDFVLCASVLVISGRGVEERRQHVLAAKRWLAQQANESVFRRAASLGGWGAPAAELARLAQDGRIDAIDAAISDDMLREFVVIAEPEEARAKIIERYAGIADRVSIEWRADHGGLLEAIAARRRQT